MYRLLIKQFFRSKTVLLTFGILMILGIISIGTGKQFLHQKKETVQKTKEKQEKHIENQTNLHKDDIGLLMYYVKFSFINPVNPLAGISIGQSDLNSHIQNIGILNLEGQKYNTDLVNPMRLQVGNLDISFLIIFLFPLVIIALTFNLWSEEVEKGTWKMVTIQGKSPFKYLMMKFSIRAVFILLTALVLLFLAKTILEIPFNTSFMGILLVSVMYLVFWLLFSFLIILLQTTSNTNAIVLLTSWLLLVVFLPVVINNYIINKYPVEEALSMTIKQRDEYHKRWDTNKKETLIKFYSHYPQFTKYGIQEKGFSWLWYYAMQQMGDDGSKKEREAMYKKIKKREELSKRIGAFFPPIQMQLVLNSLAKTDLTQQINFLEATTKFHEGLRLDFYSKIFENKPVKSVNWKKYKPEYFNDNQSLNLSNKIIPLLINIIMFLVLITMVKYKKFN